MTQKNDAKILIMKIQAFVHNQIQLKILNNT